MIVGVGDFETDPFAIKRVPRVFAAELYIPELGIRQSFWGEGKTREEVEENVISRFVACLMAIEEPVTVYFHNGGRFDFFFLLPYFDGNLRIVNGRILESKMGIHTLRDSYAAVPARLSDYQKTEIEYHKFEIEVRENWRDEIMSYLHDDCQFLYELISAFIAEFGDVLTIGSAAMRELKGLHKYDTGNANFDSLYRGYYFGGRVQCFKTGVVDMPFRVYDVNSMYPYCMAEYEHPIGVRTSMGVVVDHRTSFVKWIGRNYGGVPTRTETGLDFTVEEGTFYSTGFEFNMGLETGTIEPRRVLEAHTFLERSKFDTFVETFYSKRMKADADGNTLHKLFYKLILNSAYGKFAQDPSNFKDWLITGKDEHPGKDWFPDEEGEQYILWSKPTERHTYYNVATAASITGAARSVLLRGISHSDTPLYCDTDSIICASLADRLHEKALGHWKEEASGNRIAIAGKKIYAAFDGDVCIKSACKGARLEPAQIVSVAMGNCVMYENPVPAFKLNGNHQFINRTIRWTV